MSTSKLVAGFVMFLVFTAMIALGLALSCGGEPERGEPPQGEIPEASVEERVEDPPVGGWVTVRGYVQDCWNVEVCIVDNPNYMPETRGAAALAGLSPPLPRLLERIRVTCRVASAEPPLALLDSCVRLDP